MIIDSLTESNAPAIPTVVRAMAIFGEKLLMDNTDELAMTGDQWRNSLLEEESVNLDMMKRGMLKILRKKWKNFINFVSKDD